jgi:UDP-N-acetylglucosamine--N-acetylmuramyl-(pentapeptide) pyrophosphoryl-undecaprenol N-acetylglucosamine transferase
MFASRARCVLLGQDQAAAHLPRASRTRVVGTPVRAELSTASRVRALAHFGLADGVPTMLVLGGSQGARGLNDALLAALESLAKKNEGALQVIWCCGPGNLAALSGRLGQPGLAGAVTVRLHGFLNEMDLAYAASDFVLSRAGASTLAEVTALGLPSLLVPYPAAKDNHQHHNALALAECGAAVLLPESTLTGEHLADRILSLASAPGHRRAMAEAARGCGHPRAAEDIASLLLELPAVSPSPAAVPIPKGRVTA